MNTDIQAICEAISQARKVGHTDLAVLVTDEKLLSEIKDHQPAATMIRQYHGPYLNGAHMATLIGNGNEWSLLSIITDKDKI